MTADSARRSETLAALFGPAVVAVEWRGAAEPADEVPSAARALLTDAEWASIAHCHPRRIHDFTVGRLCAHRALEAFGVAYFSLLPGEDRQPRWPAGLTGSITHTTGYSAAVVARDSQIGALGVDAEPSEAVTPELWRHIATAGELEWLLGLPQPERARAATLLFAAKEAFYKAQFALTHEWLGFDAVRVRVEDARAASAAFRIEPLRPLRLQREFTADSAGLLPFGTHPAGGGWAGAFRCEAGFILAGLVLPVPGSRARR